MKKSLIKKEYSKKIKLIEYYNKSYYDENSPVISDADYDLLKKEIIEFEKKYNFLNKNNSPIGQVGYKPSKNFKKVLHRVPMLSLGNAFTENDLVNFEKKIKNFLSIDESSSISYTAEPKIDGISASLTYINGEFSKGLSRGDGKEGEDITFKPFDY